MQGTSPALYRLLIGAALLCAALAPSVQADAIPAGTGSYGDLVGLLDEFLAFRDPDGDEPRQIIRDEAGQAIDPIADYGEESIAWRREQMRQFQARIDDMLENSEGRVDELQVDSVVTVALPGRV